MGLGRAGFEPTELAVSPDGASEALAAASVADVVVGREICHPRWTGGTPEVSLVDRCQRLIGEEADQWWREPGGRALWCAIAGTSML